MGKTRKVKVGKLVFNREPKLKREQQLAATIAEARQLVEKVGFLVKRGEFLYQQGLIFHAQSQELLRDCAVSGQTVATMTERLDKLEAPPKKLRHVRHRRRAK